MNSKLLLVIVIVLAAIVAAVFMLPESGEAGKGVTVFYAATFSALMDTVKRDYKDASLKTEMSGSQVAIRKVTELGRDADVVISADSGLFKEIGNGRFSYRIDFAMDEIVLGVGVRAKHVDKAENDWVSVLRMPDVILARADENLGPIGYRTLLVWSLKERMGFAGLAVELKAKAEKVVDDVSAIAVLLKAGDVDYGFLYKSTALANDIRFIALEKEINLGVPGVDYSSASAKFSKNENGTKKEIMVKGSPVVYGLSVVDNAPNREGALRFIRTLFSGFKAAMEAKGFTVIAPLFYGSKEDYVAFSEITTYGGEF